MCLTPPSPDDMHSPPPPQRETDARPYSILATKSKNSQYRPAARFAHAATSILEVGVTRNRDRPPVILISSGRTPRGFSVDCPCLISN